MFQPGDTVALKSGSPPMTVSTVHDEYGVMKAYCDWFDGKKTQSAAFPLTSLKLVEMNP